MLRAQIDDYVLQFSCAFVQERKKLRDKEAAGEDVMCELLALDRAAGLIDALNNSQPVGATLYTGVTACDYTISQNLPQLPLRLLWDDIANVSATTPVTDPADVALWNAAYGWNFTSVSVVGNEVKLYGGYDVVFPSDCFKNNPSLNGVIDEAKCVIQIGSSAFENCSTLSRALLPQVAVAGDLSFYLCVSLISVDLSLLVIAPNGLFAACSAIENVSLLSCTKLTSNVFYDCSSLKSANLPICIEFGGTAPFFGGYNFYQCTQLTSVTAPLVTVIGDYTFLNSTTITTINYPLVTIVRTSAFEGCTSLTDVTLVSCTTVESSAFNGCSSLVNATMPLLQSIGSSAFLNCTSLISVSYPACTSVLSGAFVGCSSMTTVELPLLVTVNDATFNGCSSLDNPDLPLVESVSFNGAFNACSGMKTIALPLCASILGKAFKDCTSLTTIYIPACTTLGETVGNDLLFENISGNTIDVTLLNGMETDGDIVYLQGANTVNLILV